MKKLTLALLFFCTSAVAQSSEEILLFILENGTRITARASDFIAGSHGWMTTLIMYTDGQRTEHNIAATCEGEHGGIVYFEDGDQYRWSPHGNRLYDRIAKNHCELWEQLR